LSLPHQAHRTCNILLLLLASLGANNNQRIPNQVPCYASQHKRPYPPSRQPPDRTNTHSTNSLDYRRTPHITIPATRRTAVLTTMPTAITPTLGIAARLPQLASLPGRPSRKHIDCRTACLPLFPPTLTRNLSVISYQEPSSSKSEFAPEPWARR